MRMISAFCVFTALLAIPFLSATAEDEKLTITTYYPSPYGVYKNLRLHPSPEPTDGLDRGLMYFNETDEEIYFYKNNTAGWVKLSGRASPGDALVYSMHTASDCTDHVPPGEVVDTDVGFQQCRFNLPSCPTGWTQFKSYRTAPYGKAWTGEVYCVDCISSAYPWKLGIFSGSCDKIKSASSYGVNICDSFPPLPWDNNPLRSSQHGVCCGFASNGVCLGSTVMTWREMDGQSATQVGCY